MRLRGAPVRLATYPADGVWNRRFAGTDPAPFGSIYLPESLVPLMDGPPTGFVDLLEDDNRGAVSPDPVATLDGLPFYLSVKGIGAAIDPYSHRALDRSYGAELSSDPKVRERLGAAGPEPNGRLITGELWLRGSPYGGQGWEHASTALALSERAELTDLNGFRIAPVVRVAYLPPVLEERLRTLRWYRRYRGRMVQELRLVPSNVRIYFHARTTVGTDVASVFDLFGIATSAQAVRFELRFVRSALALLTLFARTLARGDRADEYRGFDLHDVWLDKDAVLAPDGTVFFVDLEGLEEVTVRREAVGEKIEDQIFRSLYEFMFAYEQIEAERGRRFGPRGPRGSHFEEIVREAIAPDPFLAVRSSPSGLELEVRNALSEQALYRTFPLLDR